MVSSVVYSVITPSKRQTLEGSEGVVQKQPEDPTSKLLIEPGPN